MWVLQDVWMFLKDVSYAHQGIYLIKYSKNSNSVKCYNNFKQLFTYYYIVYTFRKVMHFATPMLNNSLVSHNSSEIIIIWCFCAEETFLIIINVKNCIFVETMIQDFYIYLYIYIKIIAFVWNIYILKCVMPLLINLMCTCLIIIIITTTFSANLKMIF